MLNPREFSLENSPPKFEIKIRFSQAQFQTVHRAPRTMKMSQIWMAIVESVCLFRSLDCNFAFVDVEAGRIDRSETKPVCFVAPAFVRLESMHSYNWPDGCEFYFGDTKILRYPLPRVIPRLFLTGRSPYGRSFHVTSTRETFLLLSILGLTNDPVLV